jgi:surface polysaccharide O-acyltransferase-like enzyme
MHMPAVNYLAVLVTGVLIFMLGGLWYSPVMFTKRWIALQGKTMDQMKMEASTANMPLMYLQALVTSLLIAYVMAAIVPRFAPGNWMAGLHIAFFCWLGFAGATSYVSYLFSGRSKQLWLIDSGYNLVSFLIAGAILAVWR